uniref:Uncharacterized protein n=1 Tax=Magallana gigas TaxID=29159 RepID=A0A8W8P027_MAGGI
MYHENTSNTDLPAPKQEPNPYELARVDSSDNAAGTGSPSIFKRKRKCERATQTLIFRHMGPKPSTMFVLEDLVIRKYATGKQTSGTSWMLTGGSGFATLKQTGTMKIGQQRVVMQTKKPNA